MLIFAVLANSVIALASENSSSCRKAATATARYIAPVSKCGRLSSAANALATVDLPEPAGPSIAATPTTSVNGAALGRKSSSTEKKSGNVFETQPEFLISIRGTRSPSNAIDIAIR